MKNSITVTFDELNLNTPLRNVLEEMAYIYPTPIQVEALPVILSGRDVVGVAQTGTGKTFAYLLPILKGMKYSTQKHPSVLIMMPTRELVEQVVRDIEKLTKYITVRVMGIHGGDNINKQIEQINNGLDIVVATPGRLLDLILSRNLRMKAIQKYVLDEVDEMLNLGFRRQLNSVLDLLPQRRQNILFSATLTEDVAEIIEDFFISPIKVEIAPSGTPLALIDQKAYHVPNYQTKLSLLKHLLKDESLSKVLVFVESKKLADKLAEELLPLYEEGLGVIHSNKSQNYRANAIRRFEIGEHRILLATDLIARGVNIQDVTHVINFDTPDTPEHYIHRIGRTGRADKAGIAITFINEVEEKYQKEIEELMNKEIEMLPIPEEVEISDIFTLSERPDLGDKHYIQAPNKKEKGSGFHEKNFVNSKVNLGSKYKRTIKVKYKKPKTKGDKCCNLKSKKKRK